MINTFLRFETFAIIVLDTGRAVYETQSSCTMSITTLKDGPAVGSAVDRADGMSALTACSFAMLKVRFSTRCSNVPCPDGSDAPDTILGVLIVRSRVLTLVASTHTRRHLGRHRAADTGDQMLQLMAVLVAPMPAPARSPVGP